MFNLKCTSHRLLFHDYKKLINLSSTLFSTFLAYVLSVQMMEKFVKFGMSLKSNGMHFFSAYSCYVLSRHH